MWKDNLREASFRGVPFFYESTGVDGGRRTQTHEFAYRDKPYTEDLGRKAQEIPIEAYVIGDDYMTVRDNLLKACNEEGPGELIHPYYGAIKVNCQVISIRESTSDGRMARISLQFIEAGEKYFPDSSPDRSAAVDISAEKLNKNAVENFAKVFTIETAPEFIGVKALEEAYKFIDSIPQFIPKDDFKDSAILLLKHPESLALLIQSVFDELIKINNPNEKKDTFKTLTNECNYNNRLYVTFGSITHTRMVINHNAIIDLVRQLASSAAVRVATETDFKTRNEAEYTRDQIAESLESQSELTDSTSLYIALTDMRAALVQAIPKDGLPELVLISVNNPTPSLVLAYELYDDAMRGDEIVDRNKIKHPGFIGPANIQVVSEVTS